MSKYCAEALSLCGISGAEKAALAENARRLLLKSSKDEDDDHVIADLLFGSPLSTTASASAGLADKIARLMQERLSLLERSFTPIVADALLASGFASDESLAIPA